MAMKTTTSKKSDSYRMKSSNRMVLKTVALFFFSVLTTLAAQDNVIVSSFTDNGKALVNPDMGWDLYQYCHSLGTMADKTLLPRDGLTDFPGVSTVYMPIMWSTIEPEEGKFNWTIFDTPALRWIERGKKIAFRTTCLHAKEWATPKWVHDAGAKGYFFSRGDKLKVGEPGFGEKGSYWCPDFSDPIFFNKLENFIKAYAARYDGNPDIAFIDIGSFGMWGEGHTHFVGGLRYDYEVIRKHIDLHLKYFKKTQLVISDDFVDYAKSLETGARLQEYILSHGITFRDDSIMVGGDKNSKTWHQEDMMQLTAPKTFTVIEHHPEAWKQPWWMGEQLYDVVMGYRGSHISLQSGNQRGFLASNQEVVDRINRTLGYRLCVDKVILPARVFRGKPFSTLVTIANTGVAPCYPGGYLSFTLKDEKNRTALVLTEPSFSVRDLKAAWGRTPLYKTVESKFAIPAPEELQRASIPLRNGNYKVYLSIGQGDGTPVFQLPLDTAEPANERTENQYLVAEISLEDDQGNYSAVNTATTKAIKTCVDSTQKSSAVIAKQYARMEDDSKQKRENDLMAKIKNVQVWPAVGDAEPGVLYGAVFNRRDRIKTDDTSFVAATIGPPWNPATKKGSISFDVELENCIRDISFKTCNRSSQGDGMTLSVLVSQGGGGFVSEMEIPVIEKGQWNTHSVSLGSYAKKNITIRFLFQPNATTDNDSVYLGDLKLVQGKVVKKGKITVEF